MSAFAAPDDPDDLEYSYAEHHPTSTTPPVASSMSSDPELPHSRTRSNNPLLGDDNPLVSELEQEVLDEYARLLRNVNLLSEKMSDLADSPTTVTLDNLRLLERKTATVCTLLKASVYSIVLQQQIWNESEEQQQQQRQDDDEENEHDPEQQFSDQEFQHGGEYDGHGDGTFQ